MRQSVAYTAARRAAEVNAAQSKRASNSHEDVNQIDSLTSLRNSVNEQSDRLTRRIETNIVDWMQEEIKTHLIRIDDKLEQLSLQAAKSANGFATNGSNGSRWPQPHGLLQSSAPIVENDRVAAEFQRLPPSPMIVPDDIHLHGPSEHRPEHQMVVQPQGLPREIHREDTDIVATSSATLSVGQQGEDSSDIDNVYDQPSHQADFKVTEAEVAVNSSDSSHFKNSQRRDYQSSVLFSADVMGQQLSTQSGGGEQRNTRRRFSSSRRKMPASFRAASQDLDEHEILRKRRQSEHKENVFAFLSDAESSPAAWWYSHLSPFFIVLSAIFPLLQTVENTPIKGVAAAVIETVIDIIFLLEVLLRFLTCPNRKRFLVNIYNLLDIVATIPPLVMRISIDFVISDNQRQETIPVILLCIVPLFRMMKTLRRFQKFLLLLSAFGLAFEALPVLLFTLGMIALIFSSLIYIVEPRDNIKSWPDALWLTIVTMTTVGYGDKVPKSEFGYIIVAVLVVSSVLYMAMPLGIIGSAFTRIWRDRDRILLMQRTHDLLVQWGYTADDIPELFHLFDSDGSNELTLQEFTRMIAHMRLGMKNERIMELFESFDQDGSGTIDDEEFVRALFPAQYHDIYGGEDTKTDKKRSYASWSSDDDGMRISRQSSVGRVRSVKSRGRNSVR